MQNSSCLSKSSLISVADVRRRMSRAQRAEYKRMGRAAEADFFECMAELMWIEDRGGGIVYAKQHSDGSISAVGFDVDLACIGIRDVTHIHKEDVASYHSLKRRFLHTPVDCFSGMGKKIVETAIEFGRRCGFEPSIECIIASALMRNEDASRIDAPVPTMSTPLYRIREGDPASDIISKLRDTLGIDGFVVRAGAQTSTN